MKKVGKGAGDDGTIEMVCKGCGKVGEAEQMPRFFELSCAFATFPAHSEELEEVDTAHDG
eukprot:12130158-Alexandrium_andersonii.AAC.1